MIFTRDLLKGRVALVTGGGTGIGRAAAEGFAEAGAAVAVASRKMEHLELAAREIAARFSVKTAAIDVDVREPARVEAMFERAEAALGPVDILVNKAAGTFFCPAVAMSDNAWAAGYPVRARSAVQRVGAGSTSTAPSIARERPGGAWSSAASGGSST